MYKKILFFLTAAVVMLTSCSEDNDPVNITLRLNQTPIDYDSEGVWQGVATNTPFQSNYMIFAHEGEMSAFGLVWNGFTPARVSATEEQTDWLSHQFQIMPGGGVGGAGTPYVVAYWNTSENSTTPASDRSCRITYSSTIQSSSRLFRPQNVKVVNTAYTYYTMLRGSAFSRAFAAGDYLVLTAHGVHADDSETTLDFYLADCSGEDAEKWFVTTWTPFDLSGLGEVKELYFTMESSDTGRWGMNTPSMFAIDHLTIRAVLPKD